MKLVEQIEAAARIVPGVAHTDVDAEGQVGAERKRLILAEVVVWGRMPAFDRAGVHGVPGPAGPGRVLYLSRIYKAHVLANYRHEGPRSRSLIAMRVP